VTVPNPDSLSSNERGVIHETDAGKTTYVNELDVKNPLVDLCYKEVKS
jgi:hypothetical protein